MGDITIAMPTAGSDWFQATVPGVDFDVLFRLGLTDEGALVITGLHLGDDDSTQPITTSNLHRLSMGALYDAVSALPDRTAVLAHCEMFEGYLPTRGGQRTPDEKIAEAAVLYRTALLRHPQHPIQAVAEALGVSSATASRRLQVARDRGLLGREVSP